MYQGMTVKRVSTDQKPFFADDPISSFNWLFRINEHPLAS